MNDKWKCNHIEQSPGERKIISNIGMNEIG